METKVSCSDCGAVLPPPEWAHQTAEHACTDCGSVKKLVELCLIDTVELEIHEGLRGKVRDKNFSSTKNPRVDFFHGDDLRKSDGKWMRKDRIIDKDANLYIEKVVDPKTGEVVHHCEEPLSDHFGHGSAKFKRQE